jgi:hypothetical protein
MRPMPGLAAATLCLGVLGSCADDVPESEEADFVVLVDNGTDDTDMIEGEPGAYAMTARGSGTPPHAVIDVPEGFSNFGFFAVWPQGSEDNEDDDTFRSVAYWTVNGVYADPCRRTATAPEIGPTVDDLVAALVDQRHTEVTVDPEPVSLDGHDGVVLEVTVPDDVSRCDEDGRYVFWEGSPGDAHHQAPAGTTERLWVLDVDGQRVVLLTAATAVVPERDRDELTAIVESARFVEGE